MKKNSNSNVMTGLFLQSHFTFHQMSAKMEALKNKWTDRWVKRENVSMDDVPSISDKAEVSKRDCFGASLVA